MAWTTDPQSLPPRPGAYLLRIVLEHPAPLPPALGGGMLAAGTYVYAGSARGPGGIRARVARHLKRDKTRRWHIDWLTTVAARVEARAHPRKHECGLIAERLERRATVPVPGFGSSDCATCPAHLVKVRRPRRQCGE